MTRVGNWGRWGPADERGAINLLGPAEVRAATGLVRDGVVVPLAQPINRQTPMPSHRIAPAHFMDRDGADATRSAPFGFADDTLMLATHTGTHLDALAHVWSEDTLYNGFPSGSITSRGARHCGIDRVPPLVGRGVLLDLAATLGQLPAGREITAAELERAATDAGVELQPGDLVLLRTGWWPRAGGTATYFDGEPGPGPAAAAWLAAADIAVVGADNYAVEALPAEQFPVHRLLLRDHGVPILEGLDLEALAATGRTAFLLVISPLPLVGATASPVNPVAVL
ncbi:MAG: cyclase family protein [Micromonosporaceae bacterium]|nr:cyclase family protein [Micromonosporaceae bacterium]